MEHAAIEKMIRRVEEIPTLPIIITRILEVLEASDSSSKDLEQVISYDQSIAAKVLRIANSAYYGFSGEITTIHRAIVVLGFQTVRGLALGSSIFETFSRLGRTSYFDRRAFWVHSIACSRCSRALGKVVGQFDAEVAFLAGLIHDIGMVIMDHTVHDHYRQVLEKAIKRNLVLDEIERETFGFDHGRVGAWLGERWKFPSPLLAAIEFHHRVFESKDHQTLVAAINIADFCSDVAGMSIVGIENDRSLPEEVPEHLGITKEQLDPLVTMLMEETDQIEGFFSAISR